MAMALILLTRNGSFLKTKYYSFRYFQKLFMENSNLFSASLLQYLLSHPSLKGQKGKEPHFFDSEFSFPKGLDYYRSLMSETYPHQLTFEKVRCDSHTSFIENLLQ